MKVLSKIVMQHTIPFRLRKKSVFHALGDIFHGAGCLFHSVDYLFDAVE